MSFSLRGGRPEDYCKWPFLTVMAEERGRIAAPGTFRREGREAGIRCGLPERLLSGKSELSLGSLRREVSTHHDFREMQQGRGSPRPKVAQLRCENK